MVSARILDLVFGVGRLCGILSSLGHRDGGSFVYIDSSLVLFARWLSMFICDNGMPHHVYATLFDTALFINDNNFF